METDSLSIKDRPRLAVFYNLPSGGGLNVASALLRELQRSFSITVHYPFGSSPLNIPETISAKEWPFREGRRIRGLRKLFAPFSLPARLRALDKLCMRIANEINSSSDIALVHNSMFVAAPPVLKYLTIPCIYFCYEFPRHIYEKDLIRRTGNGFFNLLLSPLRSMEKNMDRESAVNADSIVTLSSWMKRRINDIYDLDSSIVRPGVDTDFWNFEKNVVRKHMVLSIGALWPFKGHKMAIDVVSRIPSDTRPALSVIADREYPGYGVELERSAALKDVDLTLHRGISNEELSHYYKSCKAVLCCQHNEPYGLVPLEAMACGLPVIAVREGGFVDNIQSGENGILVKRNPAEMAELLSMLLIDQRLWKRVAEGGRRFVTQTRTVSSGAQSLREILSGIAVV
ncbi:hypothetical protein DRQ25_17370 [Candidatus Fermentibacteria bacterium]|nr:MAG: hypothetical protein DRQ25_17370 [Candidatus Fermentibacteria bacterium]